MHSLPHLRRSGHARSTRRAAGALVATALIASSGSLTALAAEPTTTREAIPDPALYQCVRTWYEGVSGATLAPEDDVPLAAASTATAPFTCADPTVVDLTGLDLLDGTTSVTLTGAQATDLGPLGGMSGARALTLTDVPATDLGPLAATGITDLTLTRVPTSDLGPLATTPLTRLALTDVPATDLGPLAGHAITALKLVDVPITSIEAIRGMTTLVSLGASGTQVSDLSPLTDLPRLAQLAFLDSQIVDIAPVATLSALRTLELGGNHIVDVTPAMQPPRLVIAEAARQTVTLDLAAVGSPTPAFAPQDAGGPVAITRTDGPVPVEDAGTWTYPTAGTATATWDVPLRGPARFSGTVTQAVLPAGEPIDPAMPFSPPVVIDPIEPIDPAMPPAATPEPPASTEPGDPPVTAAPSAPAVPSAPSDASTADVLATTGTAVAARAVAATLLLALGGALIALARRRSA